MICGRTVPGSIDIVALLKKNKEIVHLQRTTDPLSMRYDYLEWNDSRTLTSSSPDRPVEGQLFALAFRVQFILESMIRKMHAQKNLTEACLTDSIDGVPNISLYSKPCRSKPS